MAQAVGNRRWWALAAITFGVMVAGLDATVVNLALPTLAGALHASQAELQWFIAAYTLALSAAMLPAGLLGDRYGRKRLLIASLVVFALASLASAFAPTPLAFIAARAILGAAGAGLTVMALSVVTVLFSEEERPRAVGIWAAANFIALPAGPLLGGWMLTNFWWGWVFLINAPVAMLGLAAVAAFVPESRSATRPGIDLVGVASSSAGLTAVLYGLIQAGQNGWSDVSALLPVAVGLALLAGFALWEIRLTAQPGGQPLIDIALFRSKAFTWGVILAGMGIFGLFGALFVMPQYFQAILGTDAQGSGLRLLPVIGGLVVGAVLADRLAARISPRFTVALGFAVLGIGMAVGSTMSVATGDGFIASWTFVAGLGAGLSLATAASAALSELSAERSGVGTALMQAVQKLGPAFGATILGSVLNATYVGQLQLAGVPVAAAAAAQKSVYAGIAAGRALGSTTLLDSVRASFVTGMDDALRLTAAISVHGLVLALVFLPRRTHANASAAAAPKVERGFVA